MGHGLTGSFLTILGVFLVAGFSFRGTELVGITAGESEEPEKQFQKQLNKYSGEF